MDFDTKEQHRWKITANHGKRQKCTLRRQNLRFSWIPWIRDIRLALRMSQHVFKFKKWKRRGIFRGGGETSQRMSYTYSTLTTDHVQLDMVIIFAATDRSFSVADSLSKLYTADVGNGLSRAEGLRPTQCFVSITPLHVWGVI